jgi:hypothetical protein
MAVNIPAITKSISVIMLVLPLLEHSAMNCVIAARITSVTLFDTKFGSAARRSANCSLMMTEVSLNLEMMDPPRRFDACGSLAIGSGIESVNAVLFFAFVFVFVLVFVFVCA